MSPRHEDSDAACAQPPRHVPGRCGYRHVLQSVTGAVLLEQGQGSAAAQKGRTGGRQRVWQNQSRSMEAGGLS